PGSAAILVVTADRFFFLTDSRYVTSAGQLRTAQGLELVVVAGAYDAALAELITSIGVSSIGFESAHMSVSRYQWLRSVLAADGQPTMELVPVEGLIERARVVKDDFEIATLREGARRLSDAARRILAGITRGSSEREVA